VNLPVPSLLVPFLIVVAVLTVTPGPDMVLVLRNGARGGATLAWFTGLGCCTGIAVHASAAVLGLAALLAASSAAYAAIKLVGAAYLAWLGMTALWHSRRRATDSVVAPQHEPDSSATESGLPRGGPTAAERQQSHPDTLTRRNCYRQGLLTNLLNPKIALLFLTLLPQFVAGGEPRTATSAVLAGIFLLLAVLWWRLFSLAVGGLAKLFARSAVRTWIERASGVVLLALGLRVALERT
jgi:threonine/homoserine/homoserine lactone efflux protein